MILECLHHDGSSFVTLTYDDDHLPEGGTLVPRDPQLFIKRLRKLVHPIKLRYYLVGEYGDRTFRPHYHLALFGVPPSAFQAVADAWSLDGKAIGHVVVGSLTFESAGYVAGYVTKKMTAKDDPRLEGRHPEFARMSLRPGIGAYAMNEVADMLFTKAGCAELARTGDVPAVLKHGGRSMPLGRYLRRLLREKVGIPEMGFDSPACQTQREELSFLLQGTENYPWRIRSAIVASAFKGKHRSIEVRYNIYSKKDKLL